MFPANFLQQVQTYNKANLAYLLNHNVFLHTANKKFSEFNKIPKNLGDTVTFDLPLRYVPQNSLVVNFESTQQRVQSLTVNQQAAVPVAFSNQQFIFNVQEYMEQIGKGAVNALAFKPEFYMAGFCETAPYRFYGDGVTAINSVGQLAQMLSLFKNYGYSHIDKINGYLSDVAVPQIVNSGLNQFVVDRNEDYAYEWMVANWSGVDWMQTNLLPIHTAGTVGNEAVTLTVVSTNDPTGANITQITFSGAPASDPNSILQYDNLQFADNVSGFQNMRYLTFIGYAPSANPVQIQATAQAASSGAGNVTVNIYPPLCAQVGNPNQNLSQNVQAGMQVTVLPSHRCGMLVGGNAMYLAMPQLPEQPPFPTSSLVDETTGASMRLYYGTLFGQNTMGYVYDMIYGGVVVPEYTMKIVFPL